MKIANRQMIPLLWIGALEKFSFNGIRALLVLYLTRQALLRDTQAFEAYGAMISLSFVTPILGGWASDRLLGSRRALLFGAFSAMLGLFALLLPGQVIFFFGLGLLVLGSGFIRSNVPALMGRLHDTEASRDSAFTLLYIGYNVGTFLGTLACAVIGEVFGWGWGFGMAGLAMLACTGLLLRIRNHPVWEAGPGALSSEVAPAWRNLGLLGCLPIAALLGVLITRADILFYLIPPVTALAVVLMIQLGRKGFDADGVARAPRRALRPVLTLVVLMAFHMVFYALYEQGSLSLPLFTERNVDRSMGAWLGVEQLDLFGRSLRQLPVTFFQLLDPVLNVALGGLVAYTWRKLEGGGRSMGVPLKFALGLLMLSLGFALITWGHPAGATALVSPWRMVGAYALFVIGELLTIPVGLAMVSTLAPKRHATVFMGIWFVSIGSSAWLASLLSTLTSAAGARSISAAQSLQIYSSAFARFSALALALALCLVLLRSLLSRGAHQTGTA